jgi:hypothetical protein
VGLPEKLHIQDRAYQLDELKANIIEVIHGFLKCLMDDLTKHL